MFEVGDIVEMTAEAAATGMLDFVEGDSYDVISTTGIDPQSILLENESREGGWYHSGHFKLKEDNIVEKKECLFKEGQVVWDLIYGKGAVSSVDFLNFPSYPVCVKFDQLVTYKPVLGSYTAEGISSEFGVRSLYFSEPKIEAATEPLCGTESLITQGDSVLCRVFGQGTVLSISEEYDEVQVEFKDGGTRNYTLGGKLYDLFPDEVVTLSAVKRDFTPTLKKGDKVVCIDKNIGLSSGSSIILTVIEEDEKFVKTSEYGPIGKHRRDFYRLGEKINFK